MVYDVAGGPEGVKSVCGDNSRAHLGGCDEVS